MEAKGLTQLPLPFSASRPHPLLIIINPEKLRGNQHRSQRLAMAKTLFDTLMLGAIARLSGVKPDGQR